MFDNTDRGSRQGLLINITGNGKGKSTSAFGTSLRALGWGWRVSVIQFVKSDSETGEKRFAEQTELPFEIMVMGAGFSWNRHISESEHCQAAAAAWQTATDYICNGRVDLLILDELNIALNQHWLELAGVIDTLQQRPSWMHIIVTGRYADPRLMTISDLVSWIDNIKHPFDSGITAQIGIDY